MKNVSDEADMYKFSALVHALEISIRQTLELLQDSDENQMRARNNLKAMLPLLKMMSGEFIEIVDWVEDVLDGDLPAASQVGKLRVLLDCKL